MDVSRMTELDQQRIISMRTGKKLSTTTIIDIGIEDEEYQNKLAEANKASKKKKAKKKANKKNKKAAK